MRPPVSLVWFLLSVWGSREGMRRCRQPPNPSWACRVLIRGHWSSPVRGPALGHSGPSRAFRTRLDKTGVQEAQTLSSGRFEAREWLGKAGA